MLLGQRVGAKYLIIREDLSKSVSLIFQLDTDAHG